jgi:hypothetical protein
MLARGAVILPGNWGRVIRALGWRHSEALKEMALESARRSRFPSRPSRLDCAFAFPTADEARNFRARIASFANHILYRVRLADPSAPLHITDNRLSSPQGTMRDDWADEYWRDFDPNTLSIPGIGIWATAAASAPGGLQSREILTLSPLVVEERLD